jgi:hypothetical protein
MQLRVWAWHIFSSHVSGVAGHENASLGNYIPLIFSEEPYNNGLAAETMS